MIKLDDEYYITAAQYQFILMRKRKPTKAPINGGKAKETLEETIGYYGDISAAVNRYRKEQMLQWVGSEKLTLEKLCDRVNELDAELMKKMSRLQKMEMGEDAKPRGRKKDDTKASA